MVGSKKLILIVEDNKIAQKMAMIALEAKDREVHTADTGTAAIEKFKIYHYDFIFMDLGLPDMDGYIATKTMRHLEKKQSNHTTIIIALTAHIDNEVRQNALESGMDDFLSKPLTIEKAQAIFNQYL